MIVFVEIPQRSVIEYAHTLFVLVSRYYSIHGTSCLVTLQLAYNKKWLVRALRAYEVFVWDLFLSP